MKDSTNSPGPGAYSAVDVVKAHSPAASLSGRTPIPPPTGAVDGPGPAAYASTVSTISTSPGFSMAGKVPTQYKTDAPGKSGSLFVLLLVVSVLKYSRRRSWRV